MKIIALGASNSKTSINKELAHFTANQFESKSIDLIDLNDFPLPLYSSDYEAENGLPELAIEFNKRLQDADLIIISFAEHNGTYTVIFKNLFDWISRVSLKMFENKKLFLLSTAPGPRGGVGVLEHAISRFPRHGGDIVDTFTLPEFNVNFKKTEGIVNEELKNEFTQKVNQIQLLFS